MTLKHNKLIIQIYTLNTYIYDKAINRVIHLNFINRLIRIRTNNKGKKTNKHCSTHVNFKNDFV